GAAADYDDLIARARFLSAAVNRDQADGAAVNERVAQVALVEQDRAVHGRDAHAVAVVADAGHDALHHFFRVQHAGRQRFRRRVGRGETEYVRVADRPRAQAGAERVAD